MLSSERIICVSKEVSAVPTGSSWNKTGSFVKQGYSSMWQYSVGEVLHLVK